MRADLAHVVGPAVDARLGEGDGRTADECEQLGDAFEHVAEGQDGERDIARVKRQLVAGGVDVVQHVAVSQDRTAGHALLVDRLHDGRHVGPIEPIHPCLPCLRREDPGQHRLAAGRGA